MTLLTILGALIVFSALVVCLCVVLSANDTAEERQDDLRLQLAAIKADAARRRAEREADARFGGES